MYKKLTTSVVAFTLTAAASFAQTTFVFDDGSSTGAAGLALEAESSTTFTQAGVTLSASTTFGVFNLTNSGFGPNQSGGGDDSDTFDSNIGNESMTFSFSVAGTFDSIDFSGMTDSVEQATISFAGTGGGATTYDLIDDAVASDIAPSSGDLFNIGYSFAADEVITLTAFNTNGWSLEAFTITPTLVPEPTSFALLAGVISLSAVAARRRR